MAQTAGFFNPPSDEPCYEPQMTMAEAIALRDSSGLRENCVVVVTDWVQGSQLTGPNLVELQPTSPNEFGQRAIVHTPYDNESWRGVFDLDAGIMRQLEDNLGNTIRDFEDGSAVGDFPYYGNPLVFDNYVDNSTFTGPGPTSPYVYSGNKFVDTTMDNTGLVSGSMRDCDIFGTGTHRHSGAFANWSRLTIKNATVDQSNGGSVNQMSDAIFRDGASFTHNTPNNISVSRSTFEDAFIYNNQGASGNVSFQNSRFCEGGQIQVDAGAMRGITVIDSFIGGKALIRLQPGTALKSLSISAGTEIRGAVTGDTLRILGDSTVTISESDINIAVNGWVIDGPTTSSVSISGSKIQGANFVRGPLAGNTFMTYSQMTVCDITHNGSGAMDLSSSNLNNGSIIRTATGTTGDLSIASTQANSGTIAIDSGARRLSLIRSRLDYFSSVIETSVNAASGSVGDQIDGCFFDSNGKLELASTAAAGLTPNIVSRTRVRGSSQVAQGILRIDGVSAGVWVDSCEILGGIVTLTDVPVGALGIGTSFHDNHVDAGCILTYTGGDSTAKQVRNIHLEGTSSLLISAMTGSAGGVLGDIFAASIRGQSTVNVSGARVVGQPIRDFTVEQGSSLTIPANGCVQRCRFAGGSTVNVGAFVHFDTEISIAETITLAAQNVNRLRNKAFSDIL